MPTQVWKGSLGQVKIFCGKSRNIKWSRPMFRRAQISVSLGKSWARISNAGLPVFGDEFPDGKVKAGASKCRRWRHRRNIDARG
jgi:hypothetical protein